VPSPLGSNILVTGGAGFLARALYARAEHEDWDCQFTALSRDDSKHAALQARFPDVRTVPWDVRNADSRLTFLMAGFDTVIHAAASKYVDRAELNAVDTIETNIEGSLNVLNAALEAGVQTVIGISTDKAVEPRNIYGATKMVMERAFTDMAGLSPQTRPLCVRYGNVVGSTGSVVPLFQQQLEEDGFIKLTDGRMTRFWMSPDEAIDTILYAYRSGDPGEVIIPNPRSLSMFDVARAVLGFNDRQPITDEHVKTIGMRPGEKMHEKLLHETEAIRTMRAREAPFWHVRPPGERKHYETSWISSDNAPGGLLGIAEFRSMYEEAARV
jgi:UDP-N-acetylglucosamine 4,6-dehydratase